ncbi:MULTISPECIES: hypothetical protein [unclassified Burkholderia]|uniref:hypothetical protein n=1 Tax=unclassified Burkholderia TaxID=2613784 RepID=UPI00075CD46A|nr:MULTISPECIES: hypothetical protein [unclassified Burkholderia]
MRHAGDVCPKISRAQLCAALHGVLGGGLAAFLVHTVLSWRPSLAIGSLALIAFMAGLMLRGSADTPPADAGHRPSDDLHALKARVPQWFVPIVLVFCLTTDLAIDTAAGNWSPLIAGIQAVYRLFDALPIDHGAPSPAPRTPAARPSQSRNRQPRFVRI